MNKQTKRIFATVFLWLLFLSCPVPSAAQPKAASFSELEKVILAELKETKTPGAAVAVISGGRVVFAKGFGVASIETGGPITPDTLFRLGSTTKMFTGAAVVALAEQGKLKLDAPIGDYAKQLAPKLARVTAHQLLSNSAGIGDFAAPFISHDDAALATMVRAWKDDVFFAEPGKVYSYASPGFWLAGYVIEEVSGKSYTDAMDELLFKPLGMARTTLRPLLALTWPLALGHNIQSGERPGVIRPAFNNVAMWPAGSIFSNANDLSRFVLAFLARGQLNSKQVFPSSLFAALAGKHSPIPGEPDTFYGYGLLNFDYRGVRLLMHGGFSRGYGSMIQVAPEHGFAVIVLTNKSGETLNKTTEKAKELFLPLKPVAAEPPKQVLPLTAADLAAFSGKYVNGPQTWEILAKEGLLLLKEEGAEHELKKTGEQRFSWGNTLENDVILLPGTDGKIEYIFTGLYSARRISESR
jgi:CubicO group peptidase (beta-lactamase class C family)